jgi:hypothetical protein
MSIQQIKQGIYVNTDDIILVLGIPGKSRNQEQEENNVSSMFNIISNAKSHNRYYDLSDNDPLLSIIVLRNGSVLGTSFLPKTLVKNRFQIGDSNPRKRVVPKKASVTANSPSLFL